MLQGGRGLFYRDEAVGRQFPLSYFTQLTPKKLLKTLIWQGFVTNKKDHLMGKNDICAKYAD